MSGRLGDMGPHVAYRFEEMIMSLIYAHVVCQIQEMALSHFTIFFKARSHVNKLKVACRIKKIALSPCRM